MSKVREIILGMKGSNIPSDYWVTPGIELPELDMSKLLLQDNGQSVWEHTMSVIDLLTIKNDITLLSGLFHDLGKAYVSLLDYTPSSRFPGHEAESVKITKMRLVEWGAKSYLIDRVSRLVATHMFDISNPMKDKTIRKFIADIGFDNVDNWFILRIADSRSYAAQQKYQNHFIEPFRKSVMLFLKRQPNMGQPNFDMIGEAGVMQIEGGNDS